MAFKIKSDWFCVTGTEEEAAEAYDIAAIKFRGLNAVTNFDMSRYDVKAILESNALPIGGGAAKRLKEAQALESSRKREEMIALTSTFQYGSSSNSSANACPLQAYPLMAAPQHFEAQPFLSLQNQEITQYGGGGGGHESQYQSYIQTQLQLHQQNTHNFYNNYLQTNQVLMHGLLENVGSSSGSYSGGVGGTGGYNGNIGGGHEELALVKVDYDNMANSGGGWSGESSSVHQAGSNPSVFTMWNEWINMKTSDEREIERMSAI